MERLLRGVRINRIYVLTGTVFFDTLSVRKVCQKEPSPLTQKELSPLTHLQTFNVFRYVFCSGVIR